MMTDVLIDTNVWIYAMDKKSIHHQTAKNILLNPDHNLFITSKNVSEFFGVSTKQQIDPKTILESYLAIRSVSQILFSTLQTLSIFETLIQKYQPKGNQVYDIEIATFNRKDFINITEVEILEIPHK